MAFLFDDANAEGLGIDTSLIQLPLSFSAIAEIDAALNQTFLSVGDLGAGNQYHQLGVSSAGVFRVRSRAGGTSTATHGTALNPGTTHQVGCRIAAANREPCLDGVIGNQSTASRTPTMDRFAVGSIANNAGGGVEPLSGIMQEIGVWNIQLSDADFAQLGARVSPLLVRPEALIFYLPCFNADFLDKVAGLTLAGFTNTPDVADHRRVFYPTAAGR